MQAESSEIKTVYKYREPSLFTLRNLEKGQLRFSTPSDFNDPFDCMITTETKGEEVDWVRWLSRQPGNRSDKERILAHLREIEFDGSKYTGNKGQTDSVYVLSLSERNDSVLMWSHYARFHSGIALGFRIETLGDSVGLRFNHEDCTDVVNNISSGYLPIYKVDYNENLPKPYNTLKEEPKRLFDFTSRKHPDWRYELERRIVVSKNMIKTQNVRFEKDILVEVIYGYKTEKDIIDLVEVILQTRYPNTGSKIKRRKAVPVSGKYAVDIVDF